MPNNPPATSILEFLTHPNPTVSHISTGSKTNTRGKNWLSPRQIKRWDDFDNPSVLKASFGGYLLQEARRRGRDLPHYPHTHPRYDCEIRNENDTRDLLQNWNRTIVNAALDAVQHELHPAIWAKGKDGPPSTKERSEPTPPPPPEPEKVPRRPPRKCSSREKAPRPQSLARLKPDSGSSSLDPLLPAGHDRQERFPKEYKPAFKWKSESIVESQLIDDAGKWNKGKRNANEAMPIRQAFSYCVKHMCRYGCILTCEEAFIFRVKPLGNEPGRGSQDLGSLRQRLTHHGLMEYTSIPWDSHRQGDVQGHDTWTVNLALWFVHVLAGNNYEVEWEYGPLEDEKLAAPTPVRMRDERIAVFAKGLRDEDENEEEESDGSSDSGESDVTVPFEISPLIKRKREPESEDLEGYNLSFTKRLFVEV